MNRQYPTQLQLKVKELLLTAIQIVYFKQQ